MLLTVAARFCPTYQDVTANRARNNIQESLQDLGADTLYTDGQPIDPDLEQKGQPNCKPLSNWTFTLGDGIAGALTGTWGSLSIVSHPSRTIVTQPSIPLLNDQGQNTGKTLAGAATVTLTQAEANLAANHNLWIQGGTVDDPVLDKQFPGQYGFAALRCAIDNLNGDNVEWIGYPNGASHVFCYAYYVQPPPTSGTITVVKHVSDPAGTTATFPFHGNVSYNEGGAFDLTVTNGNDDSITFFRAETRPGDQPWDFTEDVPDGWHLNGITCSSKTGKSSTSSSVSTATTTVTLAAGDDVVCTYTDSLAPPPNGGLSITKTTIGGVGTFQYTVKPVGGGTATEASATTTAPRVPTAATPATLPLAPGQYTITESLPSSRGGRWLLTGVQCGGEPVPAHNPVKVTIQSGTGVVCNFDNRFRPRGVIAIAKVAYGNTGTAGFQITPLPSLPQDVAYSKTAKVTQEGAPVLARGDRTNALRLGRYKIQEFAAGGTDPAGWQLTSVVCNGQLHAASQGAVTVALTPRHPRMLCIFTNTFTPGPIPPEPEPPIPPDPIPTADIRVNKEPGQVTAVVGDIVTYTITVKNVGNAPAQDVVLAEQTPRKTSTIVSITTTQGTCRFDHYPASCELGVIEPGKTVTITAKLRATDVGSMPNNVAVNSSTDEFKPPTDHSRGKVKRKPKAKSGAFTG
jgi:uncharacterized repeat protein (TIGR01451 family)